jgi:hypothetical protein
MKSKYTPQNHHGWTILLLSIAVILLVFSFPTHVDTLFAIIFAPVSAPFAWISRVTALGDTTQLAFLGLLFVNFPLGSSLNAVRSKAKKTWISLLVGLFYCFFVYNWGAFAILQWVLLSYALLLLLPRAYSHQVVFFTGMIFLSLWYENRPFLPFKHLLLRIKLF